MSSPPPKIGLIGCGLIGRKRLLHLPRGCVTAAFDLDRARAESLAALSPGCTVAATLEELLASPDVQAVMIATVNASLAPIAALAMRTGKHVLVEKPAAIRVAEIDELQILAGRHRVVARVGYNHRYHPACLKAAEIVRSGALGPLMFVRGRYGQGGRVGYEREWRANPALSGGGELIDQGVHLIDLAGSFLGPFTRVDGHAATYFWDMPVDDNAFLNLRTENGQTAWLHVSCTEWKNLFSLEIYGRHGKLHWEGLGGSYGPERLTHYQMRPEMGPPDTLVHEFPRDDTSWRVEMEDFFEDILSGRTPVPGLTEARAALQVVEAIHRQCGFPRVRP